jgi:hypothetical protein
VILPVVCVALLYDLCGVSCCDLTCGVCGIIV